ncbi:DUF4252 domain-containing protein [Flavobacterium orientale]|uniref:DUF4252 domain-containing protein n=1 Tax=Flavobacterium orientale TaxID=1756020 RepID=A0A916Y3W8_9FLAO|nr:DUF4252 domain-containing protein [Flavobacterium orientale]GGD29619.1 hypothetical protein GCM10011343_19760 [Flavobacterium orientale]
MKVLKILVLILTATLLWSCQSEPTLQKYFVENSESSDFIVVDLATNMLNIKPEELSENEKEAFQSLNKLNILAFKKSDSLETKYNLEKTKVVEILKQEKYEQLMKVGSGSSGATIYSVGNENTIDEFVIYGNSKEAGFAVVRILGNSMKPEHLMTLIEVIKKADIQSDQLKPLEALLK